MNWPWQSTPAGPTEADKKKAAEEAKAAAEKAAEEAKAAAEAKLKAEDERRGSVITALAAGVTVLSGALGLFGGLTGAVARMGRNYPGESAWAIGFVVTAVVLAIGARLFAPDATSANAAEASTARRVRTAAAAASAAPGAPAETGKPGDPAKVMLVLSLIFLAVGVIWSVTLMATILDADDRPSVTATPTRDDEGVITLAGTARAGGLSAQEQVYVLAVAYDADTHQGVQIYYALAGPDADGKVEHPFSLILDPNVERVSVSVDRSSQPRICYPEQPNPVEPESTATPSLPIVRPGVGCAAISIPILPVPTTPPTSNGSASPTPTTTAT